MKKITIILLLVLVFACSSPTDTKVEKPNVLFILADDLGYSDLSCMGSNYYETPNIDAIAKSGMVFTNGYAGAQVSSPSRATIMTGQFTARHGITDWIGAKTGEAWREKKRYSKLLPPKYKHFISKNTYTLPEALKTNGYTTFFAGKWHLGGKGHYPEDYGFDINEGGFHKGSPPGGYFAPFRNPKLKDHENSENLSIRLAKETATFMESSTNKPFFAFLSFYAVHAPIQTTREKWKKYRDKAEAMGIAEEGFEDGDIFPMRKYQDNPVYAGLIETMDNAVGLVMDALKENGLKENTIVIFTSDNGGVVSGDNYSTNCSPLKGGKGYQWEGGIRVPFLVNVPWMKHRGQKNNTPVIGSDFYPTILDLAGIPLHPNSHIDGKSIVPLLKGKSIDKRPLYWHYPHYGNQGGRPVSIMRKGKWKLIHYYEDGHKELYNLEADIHEDNNLIKEKNGIARAMTDSLMSWLKNTNANYPAPDPLHKEKLEKKIVEERKIKIKKRLEKLRENMLSEDWKPNEDWWGSVVTED